MIQLKLFKKRTIQKALTRKGFQLDGKSHHIQFVLVVDGCWTSVRTKVSHGGGEPGRDLISKMRKDLRFESQEDFEKFIECTLSYNEYVDYLKTKNIVRM